MHPSNNNFVNTEYQKPECYQPNQAQCRNHRVQDQEEGNNQTQDIHNQTENEVSVRNAFKVPRKDDTYY